MQKIGVLGKFFGIRDATELRSDRCQQVVSDEPFSALGVPEQFGHGQEKRSPTLQPAAGVAAVGGFEEWLKSGGVGVEIPQPGFGSFAVMYTIDTPVFFNFKMIIEIKEQMVTGHNAS